MFNIGGPELIVILFVALIFLGPERLPTAARQVGKTIATLRGMAQGFQREFEDAINIAEDSAREADARAKGAAAVAASRTAAGELNDPGDLSDPDDSIDPDDRVGPDEDADFDDRVGPDEDADPDDESVTDADDATVGLGFDATAEPDRTEKPVSSDGPMFHSAGPGVGPPIAKRSPEPAASTAMSNGSAEKAQSVSERNGSNGSAENAESNGAAERGDVESSTELDA